MDSPQLLPHVEQRGIVVNKGANLMYYHKEYADVHGPRVRQRSVYIACSYTQQLKKGVTKLQGQLQAAVTASKSSQNTQIIKKMEMFMAQE